MKNIRFQGRIERVSDEEASRRVKAGGEYVSKEALRRQAIDDREQFAADRLVQPIRRRRGGRYSV